ncbi:MerR family transcriptional regulator [Bacillus sp. BRMEA1]|uniref:MerR family transcriptional regulator n=1 Tax=Neobacillus endophyticus TaxID=2738405 RepID=UPI00156620A3|nr:MerR family transcriptional regulator [Neobacillus endophyticus]NRD80392.1 MerR family transcriptional regulator [Neobacillus endophyticus]
MKVYTLSEVSKKINVAVRNIKQWEKELEDILDVPRSKQGARIYSDTEIQLLLEIKQMYAKKLSKDKIRQVLQKFEPEPKEFPEKFENPVTIPEPSVHTYEVITQTTPTSEAASENQLQNAQLFFEAMDTYKKTFLNEVKDEIRSVVRKEVVDEIKKEISNCNLKAVKTFSDSVYKSNANTMAELEKLSGAIDKASELTADKIQYLADNIKHSSFGTSDEILTLSKQLADTTEEISHHIEFTTSEISHLTEVISRERELLIEDREELRHEIKQREAAFQHMLTNFRETAAAKNRSWWKFWA